MGKVVVITGAAGNIGVKLTEHLRAQGGYDLRLIDRDPRGARDIVAADLSTMDEAWGRQFDGADVVVHLAANGDATASWGALVGPNLDAVLNVYLAALQRGVPRVVFASSVWTKAGAFSAASHLRADAAAPGDNAYGASKAFGENVGRAFASFGLSTVAIRLGACRAGENHPTPATTAWENECWISNRDTCHGLERAIVADVSGFVCVNLISANPGSRWSLDEARAFIQYRPQDGYRPPHQSRWRHAKARLGRLMRAVLAPRAARAQSPRAH